MTSNANKPASPVGRGGFGTDGLTKREYFAGLAMQGYIARATMGEADRRARAAVEHADALLAELERTS